VCVCVRVRVMRRTINTLLHKHHWTLQPHDPSPSHSPTRSTCTVCRRDKNTLVGTLSPTGTQWPRCSRCILL